MAIVGTYTIKFTSGNSAYGSLLLDQSKFTVTKYVEGSKKLSRQLNSKEFIHYSEINTDLYEVLASPKRIEYNLPIQLGFFVLQYAKLRILQFYYKCVLHYVDLHDFQAIQMDTDSLYLALSGETINSVVKPAMKDQFDAVLNMCTNGTDTDNIDDRFLSRTCCEPCASWDKRVPGLFKIEQTGTEMIALCSKTYLVVDGDNTKMSSKGVNKSRVENPYETFLQVLNNRTSEYV